MFTRTTTKVLRLVKNNNTINYNNSTKSAIVRCFGTKGGKDGISNVKLDRNEKDGKKYIEMHDKVIMNTYARVPDVVVTHGKDSYLYDMKGDKYLDFGSGIAVNALGHSNNEWVKAVTEQANKVTHLSNLYYNQPAIELAQALIGNTACFDKVFFANSGTEANEAALKFAKKIGIEKYPTKYEIIAFTQGFSGRSMGSLSCTYKAKYREIYGPLVPGVHFAIYNDLESVRQLIDAKKTAAVIIEPIQGEGGLESVSMDFIKGLAQLCKENDVILIADEVQCGLGRTGRLFAHERFIDVAKPDIMTLAKPLAGGLPIGATLVSDKVAQAIHPGDHGTTFGGGPLACEVANFVFSKISSPAFLKDVQEKGEYMLSKLKSLESGKKHIKELRTVGGLFIGLEIDRNVNDLIKFAKDNKVLFISAGENTVRLCPPLTITKPEIDIAINVIDKYFKTL